MFKLKRRMKVMLLCAGLIGCSTVIAQTTQPAQQEQKQVNVPDAELEKFAHAYQRIQVAQQEAQKKMIAVVVEQDLEIETFNKIHQAKMQNQELEATENELQKHAQAVEKIEKMQPSIQAEMVKIITDADLTVETYEQIVGALQTNPDLIKKLQKIMEG